MNRQALSNASGFTLLEVVVALAILLIGILAVMQLFPAALTQSRLAAERSMVASLARTELGKVRTGGPGNFLAEWGKKNAFKNLSDAERAYSLYQGWRSSVQRIGGETDLYRVTFSVLLQDGREEEFVTYVTRE
jgi:prepilin-type N-terminal cleavage/methylation domain-containing protein